MLVLCAAACESAFNTLSRISAVNAAADRNEPSSPVAQTAIVSAIALVLCMIPAAFEQPLSKISGIGPAGWAALLWYGVFVTALAFICWYSGIKRCGALTAAAFTGMMPFTSMLLSVIILGESIDYLQWLGGFLVITGMVLIGTESTDAASAKSKEFKIMGKGWEKE